MTPHPVDARTLAARNFVAPRDTLTNPTRRDLMVRSAGLGLGVASAALLGACHGDDGYYDNRRDTGSGTNILASSDAMVLNFALNLEYLEAEFYQRAVNGTALPASMTGGHGFYGTVIGGRQVAFTTDTTRQYAKEIAHNELEHVALVRAALGSAVIARPTLDLQDSFTTLFRTAGVIGADETFDPYANEVNFLLAAYVFEDVGVTAYKGSAALLSSKAILETASGILAAEAYHASILRTVLYGLGVDMPSANTRQNADKISDARDSVDGSTERDQGISPGQGYNAYVNSNSDTSNIVPADVNAIAFGRTAPPGAERRLPDGQRDHRGRVFPRRRQRQHLHQQHHRHQQRRLSAVSGALSGVFR